MTNVSRTEMQNLRTEIQQVLVAQYSCSVGMRVMCCAYPTRGIYLLDGLARNVIESGHLEMGIDEYLLNMPLRDYIALEAALVNGTESGMLLGKVG